MINVASASTIIIVQTFEDCDKYSNIICCHIPFSLLRVYVHYIVILEVRDHMLTDPTL